MTRLNAARGWLTKPEGSSRVSIPTKAQAECRWKIQERAENLGEGSKELN